VNEEIHIPGVLERRRIGLRDSEPTSAKDMLEIQTSRYKDIRKG
jgi:hypothetical protein